MFIAYCIVSYLLISLLFPSSLERTDKVPLGSIRDVMSEPITGQEDYHIMVRACIVKPCYDNSIVGPV